MLEQLAAVLGAKKTVMVAGFLGAVISLRFVTEVGSLWSRATLVLCGTVCAAYATPALADWLGASERIESGMAFALGLFGMSLAGALIAAIREAKISEQLATWFKRPGA